MESIPSAEKIAEPVAVQGSRPHHAPEGHERCAYYVNGRITCSHEEEATGAFYNEDFIFELRTTAHRLIASIKLANLPAGRRDIQQMMRYLHRLEELTR